MKLITDEGVTNVVCMGGKSQGMNKTDFLLDMNGKEVKFGHIIAVRYVWNSYVGVSRMEGLYAESKSVDKAFFSPHSYSDKATYQILGHVDENHKDFNKEVFDWYNSDIDKCPIKITVYDNMETV